MRLAVVLAPSDPSIGDAAARRETLAWLRGELARFGFHVVIVGGGADPLGDLVRAVTKVSAGDTVLMHASGRLVGRAALGCGAAEAIALGAIGEMLAARAPAHASFVVELSHEEAPDDPLLATELLGQVVDALGARERGYPALAAVRPLAARIDRFAFTRLALPPASDHAGPPPTETIVAAMYERAAAMPETHDVVQSFTFARAPSSQAATDDPPPPGAELSIAPPPGDGSPSIHSQIAEATEARDWERALLLRRARLDTLVSPGQRARELVAIARILQVELGDADGAIAALEAARAMDPRRTSVLLALRRGYERLGRWNDALDVLGALAALAPSPAERVTLHVAQARILLERIGDRGRAVEWLQAAIDQDPTHAEALGLLKQILPQDAIDVAALERRADRLLAAGAYEEALNELEAMAARSPMRPSVYEKTFAASWRLGRPDAAFLAALALEELDAADVDQQILVDQYRSVGPVRVREPLDDEGWSALRAPGADAALERVLAAVERAAIAVRVEELRGRRVLLSLDAAQRLDETSTVSIGRTMHWAARVLSVPVPHLYVTDAAGPGVVAVHAREPSIALGPSAVSGRSPKDLAFLAARQLAYYRPEYHALVYYPTRDDLQALLLAAAQVVAPGAAAPGDAATKALRAGLARHFDHRDNREAREALERAIADLAARGGGADVDAWIAGVERTACRAGLLLCGDLAAATAILRAEPGGAVGHADAKRGDLVAFCASRAHAMLRRRFTAAAAPEGAHPAPPSSAHAFP